MFSFLKPKVQCPRCQGKGNVDWDDIVRLGQELQWIPGPCAYCNGKGKVSARMISKLNADYSYLTIDIGSEERRRLFKGDENARLRGAYFLEQKNLIIAQIKYLHSKANLDTGSITEFLLIERSKEQITESERQEIIEYVNRVIADQSTG